MTMLDEIEIHTSLVKQFHYQSLPCRYIYTCTFYMYLFACVCVGAHMHAGSQLFPSTIGAWNQTQAIKLNDRLLFLVSPPLKNIFFKNK